MLGWVMMVYSVSAREIPEQTQTVLTLDDFLAAAAAKDTEFEEILMDELTLQYRKALTLPAGDLVVSVKQRHEFFLDQDRDSPDTDVTLSKLFPMSGTQWDAAYSAGESSTSSLTASELSVGLTQPIARNALGHATRLLDRMTGLELDVARHQIAEAYEDYLAVVMAAYYQWYAAYENLKVGRSSYQSNLKLLENILDRQAQKIALPIDVNKVRLQVISKQERLLELEQAYVAQRHIIERMIRYDQDTELIPAAPSNPRADDQDVGTQFEIFVRTARTFEILRKLEKRSGLEVSREANDLFPSLDLLVSYQMEGRNYSLDNATESLYAGVQMEWPMGHQLDRAEYQTARIRERQTRLHTGNVYERMWTQLNNLSLNLQREKNLIAVARERIELAQAVLTDEAENYSFGRITLNDYIQAVNALDTSRFTQIAHALAYQEFQIEWLRLTDQLITAAEIPEPKP